MSYKQLVYVAHPCGSDIKANTKECRNIISMLTKKLGDKYIFISPVLNYSHLVHMGKSLKQNANPRSYPTD